MAFDSEMRDAAARTAIVIGGAAGIGKSICERLASEGYKIMLADLGLAGAQETVARLSGEGHRAFATDITVEAEVDALLNEVERVSPAAILILVAGGTFVDPANVPNVTQMTTDEWDKTLALNITGTFFSVRRFAAQRLAKPLPHTRIVTFTSGSAQHGGTPTGVAYAASKAAVIGLTRVVAFELAPHAITVNTVAPGPTGTPVFFRNTSEEGRAALLKDTPIGRLADPDEIASGVAFLVSEQASYVTGTTFDINGGLHMH